MPALPPREAAEQLLAWLDGPARQARLLTRLLSALARPGLVVGLSLSGERRVLSVGQGDLSADTAFEVASLTKPFSAALLMLLARRGLIGLDTPLAGQFAAFRELPARVTPLALATHTAGLPGQPLRATLSSFTRFYDPFGALAPEGVIASARRWARLSLPPPLPQGPRYSNLGYGLLGLALEAASGLALPDLLRHALTLPLGLRRTSFGLPDAPRATPHLLGRAVPPTAFGGLRGAGGLWSSAHDLLGWLEAQQAAQQEGAGELGAALAATQTERLRLRPGTAWAQGVAAGWFCARPGAGAWRWHGGTARGTRSAVGFTPGGGLGLVVLTDSGLAGNGVQPEHLLFQLAGFAG